MFFALTYGLLGGLRRTPRVLVLSIPAAIVTALLPWIVFFVTRSALRSLGLQVERPVLAAVALTGAAFAGAFVFGAYIAALTFLGLERTQAFTALDHPGFKHFVRFRVRADGSAITKYAI